MPKINVYLPDELVVREVGSVRRSAHCAPLDQDGAPSFTRFTERVRTALAGAKRVRERSVKEALALGHNYVGCEHLLLALFADEVGLAGRVLGRMGLDYRHARRTVVTMLAGVTHAREATAPPVSSPLDEILRRLERHRTPPRQLTVPPTWLRP